MARNYDPHKPSDVRAFIQEIARLTRGGPIGCEQAERMIQSYQRTAEGRELLENASRRSRITAQECAVDFSSVKIHTDADPSEIKHKIQSRAFAGGADIDFRSNTFADDRSAELLAHELTHVVQQSAAKGKK